MRLRKSYSNEGHVKEDIRKVLNELCPYISYYSPVSGGFGTHGIADFVVCAYGAYLEIEAKLAPEKPTGRQADHGREIVLAGGNYIVITQLNVAVLHKFIVKRYSVCPY